MGVVRCAVRYENDEIHLFPYWRQTRPEEALALLLNDPITRIGKDELMPCFDVEELRHRNLLLKESRKCS